LLVVVLKTLSCFVQPFEEVHHVSQADIDLQLVDKLENLGGLHLAVDVQSDFGAVKAQAFLVHNHYFPCGLRFLIVALHIKDFLVFYLGDAHNQKGDQLPELNDALP
jgi:hypothetical protein